VFQPKIGEKQNPHDLHPTRNWDMRDFRFLLQPPYVQGNLDFSEPGRKDSVYVVKAVIS